MDGIFSDGVGSRRVAQSTVDLVRHVGAKCNAEMHLSQQRVIGFPGANERLSVDHLREERENKNKRGAPAHDRHNLLSEGFLLQQCRERFRQTGSSKLPLPAFGRERALLGRTMHANSDSQRDQEHAEYEGIDSQQPNQAQDPSAGEDHQEDGEQD